MKIQSAFCVYTIFKHSWRKKKGEREIERDRDREGHGKYPKEEKIEATEIKNALESISFFFLCDVQGDHITHAHSNGQYNVKCIYFK